MAAQSPRPKLPPLTALRAFEAAGRLGGFTPAARELGVTPGAVTAHLKTLESALGVQLFERRHKGVSLTDVGARVLPEFTRAFRQLDAAVQRLETEAAPGLVRIATSADLAQLWLSPRLPELRRRGLQVVPVPVDSAEAARGLADLALFPQPGQGRGHHGGPGGMELIAIAAPAYADALSGPRAIDPFEALTLAGPLGDWEKWSQAAGIPGFQPRGAVHGSAALAVEEAANGAGVLVIARPLAEGALGQGRVVDPFGIAADSGYRLDLRPLRDLAEGSAAATVLAALA